MIDNEFHRISREIRAAIDAAERPLPQHLAWCEQLLDRLLDCETKLSIFQSTAIAAYPEDIREAFLTILFKARGGRGSELDAKWCERSQGVAA